MQLPISCSHAVEISMIIWSWSDGYRRGRFTFYFRIKNKRVNTPILIIWLGLNDSVTAVIYWMQWIKVREPTSPIISVATNPNSQFSPGGHSLSLSACNGEEEREMRERLR